MELIKDIKSNINPFFTLDYMTTAEENKYFDRKSAKIKVSDLADLISAFANAEGGTIVIGISDKTKKVEGINAFDAEKINNFISAPKDCCKPMPNYKEEFLDVINVAGEKDRILLIHIFTSVDQVIRTNSDATFLRIGDRTKEIKGEDLKNLEYSKSTRHYEDECNMDAEISDLSEELLTAYKRKIGAEEVDTRRVLKARGFIKKNGKGEYLTNAAVLLFAENIFQFYPNCRIRFLRYDGTAEQVGTKINIIKDVNLEYPLLKIIEKAKEFVSVQLREFTALNQTTGRFQIVPEYPEFAWLEGLVNAVTHRDYSISGEYIRVTMFDDRIEFLSPGRLPSIVTVENIQTTRFSRNPLIARVLSDFGWVRELNEGVKRIYTDMKLYFLDPPIFSEPNRRTVQLELKNNIASRSLRKMEGLKSITVQEWAKLKPLDRDIIYYIANIEHCTPRRLEESVGRSRQAVLQHVKKLLKENGGPIEEHCSAPNDPRKYYTID